MYWWKHSSLKKSFKGMHLIILWRGLLIETGSKFLVNFLTKLLSRRSIYTCDYHVTRFHDQISDTGFNQVLVQY